MVLGASWQQRILSPFPELERKSTRSCAYGSVHTDSRAIVSLGLPWLPRLVWAVAGSLAHLHCRLGQLRVENENDGAERSGIQASNSHSPAIWLILPELMCSFQRLSHACLSIIVLNEKPRTAHYNSYNLLDLEQLLG
jgi:hypothetical protein